VRPAPVGARYTQGRPRCVYRGEPCEGVHPEGPVAALYCWHHAVVGHCFALCEACAQRWRAHGTVPLRLHTIP
jgi:hypothetical protein